LNKAKLKGHPLKKQEVRCPSVNGIVLNVTLKISNVIRAIPSKMVNPERFITAGIAIAIFLKPRILPWQA
jgi:hypothetical protein